MAFVSSLSITNEVNIANVHVSTANYPISTVDSPDNTANLISFLSIRARRYFQRTGKKITINGSDTTGYDKSKVECFNCHKMGHFARECRGPRNQDNRNRNQDNSRRTVNVEETSSKAMVAIDGAGFDWSFMADEEVPTNMALMAFSDSEVYNDKTCTNTCLKSFETLKTQYDNLRVEFNKSEFNLATYKRGLASVEEQLVFYKKNEVMFCDQIVVLKRDTSFKDSEINALKSEIEKLKKEKESNQIKIDKFENASKSLDKLIGSQISDNSRKGVGFVSYNVVPPPPTGLFAPPTIDLSNSGLEEFQQPEFEGYGPKASKSVCKDTSNEVKKTPDAPLGEKLVSEKEKQTVFPTKIESVKQQEKPARKPVKLTAITIKGKGWNMTPRAVLMKTGLKPLNTARPVNTAHPKTTVYRARPMSCFSKLAQSTVKRPYQSRTTLTNKNSNQKVNTTKEKVYTAKPKAVNTARPTSAVVNAVRANQGHLQKEDQGYVDSGCSRHMTCNMSYLSDFKEFDGGYVTFGGGARGGRITGKGTLKTGKLDFEDVYFVKELQFNLFSVSQMCDKKNSVLFTDTACFVLSPDFKLPDESQVLLKVPRKNNMYSVDMKNIVPKESLTCLVAKATLDESMLWHRRLGKATQSLSCKSKIQISITQPLFMLHMDLFGPTFVSSLMNKKYCLVVTDDYSRFTWVFFLASKDETSGILKKFITEIENLVDKKVKIIRCDNGTEFNNRVMNEFCKKKGIKREFSVAERRNRTLIKAARTMLADCKLPTIFFAEAINTACYVQNRVIIVKPHNKTTYELFRGRTPALSFMRPFECHVTILNTLDHLGKFDGKSDDGDGPKWLFDIDSLTKSMNYVPVVAGTNSNDFAGLEECNGAESTLEATHADLFGDETEMDMSNLTTSYQVPTTPNTRIHKDHSLDHVIGDIQSGVQTRGMTKNTNEHGFISVVYEGKTHEDLHTCLFACFLSQEEPKRIAKALSKRAIGTKWIFRNKKDERGIVTRNKARLMDVKSAFLYGTIEEEVYVCQPPGFEDLTILIKVYNDEFYGRTQFLLRCQSASTLMDTEKPLLKDSDGDDVDVHLYRSMIGSLMYLTSSRTRTLCLWYVHVPDLSYTKVSHSHAVKRIFRYLKGQPKLGLWYPRNSPFDLVAYSDSDYAGASLDRKNKTTGGCSVPMLRASTLVSESKLGNGYNFMHTMFNIDNNSTIYLLIKALDAGRFQYLVASIGMLNP
ncbi:putative ribonuclease H-like domain-containing protein [Tanacetum coccineum]